MIHSTNTRNYTKTYLNTFFALVTIKMFTLYRSIQPPCCDSSNHKRVNQRKARLVNTQKILQNNLYNKIELVKNIGHCNPNNKSMTSECFQMWDEIEELSGILSNIRHEIKTIDKEDNDETYQRNITLLSRKKQYPEL